MKRASTESLEVGFRLEDFPREIKLLIFLSVFPYVLKSLDWGELQQLRFISKHYAAFVEEDLVPGLRSISFNLLYKFGRKIVVCLRDIEKIHILPLNGIDWTEQLGKWRKLTNLNITYGDDVDPSGLTKLTSLRCGSIDISRLTLLTSLKCGKLAKDSDLIPLLGLRKLSLKLNNRITDESLSRLTNLTQLCLFDDGRCTNAHTLVTGSSLENLPNLQILMVKNVEEGGITARYFSGLSCLKKLKLSGIRMMESDFEGLRNLEVLKIGRRVQCNIRFISVLINLNKLILRQSDDVVGSVGALYGLKNLRKLKFQLCCNLENFEGLNELMNLTDLSLDGYTGVRDCHITGLQNLQILSLQSNQYITGKSVSLLTNLTELDLRGNNRITTKDLWPLKKLQKVRERDDRVYYFTPSATQINAL